MAVLNLSILAVLNLSIFGYILTNLEQSDKAKKNTLPEREIQNVQDVGHYKSLYHVRGFFWGSLIPGFPQVDILYIFMTVLNLTMFG